MAVRYSSVNFYFWSVGREVYEMYFCLRSRQTGHVFSKGKYHVISFSHVAKLRKPFRFMVLKKCRHWI